MPKDKDLMGIFLKAILAFNVVDIANKIELIITEYNDIVGRIARIDLKEQFSWGEIAQKYYNIYKSIVGK